METNPKQSPIPPRIAKATSPRFRDRVALLFFDDHEMFRVFDSVAERDQWIDETVGLGLAERIHVHCSDPDCTCTFPTLVLPNDPTGGVPREKSARREGRRGGKAARERRRQRRAA